MKTLYFVDFNIPDVISNSESLIDQLLSKIYITASRARVHCCLILIMRDIDIYTRFKREMDVFYVLNPGLTTELAEWNKTKKRVKEEFEEIINTLNSHMTSNGNYTCLSEYATAMTPSTEY